MTPKSNALNLAQSAFEAVCKERDEARGEAINKTESIQLAANRIDELKQRSEHWCDMHTIAVKERDRLAEELTVAAADMLNKDVVLRDILTLAQGLHQHGPAGMSRRTASAMLAALARVLPGIEVPPLIEPSAAKCGQPADKATEKITLPRPDNEPEPSNL